MSDETKPGTPLEIAAKELVACAMNECHNAYNAGFCRGIATVIVVGGTGGDITKEAANNVLIALGPHLSPEMHSEIARVIHELTAMVQFQVAAAAKDTKPN